MFVRIRLPIGEAHSAVLVIDKAISSDQGIKYVYVIDGENRVQYRRITTGALQDDGLRVIAEGLGGEDRVVVGGLQQVRPKMQVQIEVVPMPSLGQEGAGPAATAPSQPKSEPGQPKSKAVQPGG
jgi:multidrug efflux system membrane fusion protein